ncbi:MAG: class II aldolase/adducin family protein [Chitinivorax sp.]
MSDRNSLGQALIDAALLLDAKGVNQGMSGNLSVRCDNGYLITPSGMAYDQCTPEDMVWMGFDGAVDGRRKPSSEWRFHHDILASRPEIGAVIHTHSRFATTLACLQRDIPAFHYMIAMAGGNSIRCTPYATFGTQVLSDLALAALQGRKACLLGNHGLIVLGETLQRALALTIEVESLCEMYWRTLQIGQPILLSDAEMALVQEKFKHYGSNAQQPEADGSE